MLGNPLILLALFGLLGQSRKLNGAAAPGARPAGGPATRPPEERAAVEAAVQQAVNETLRKQGGSAAVVDLPEPPAQPATQLDRLATEAVARRKRAEKSKPAAKPKPKMVAVIGPATVTSRGGKPVAPAADAPVINVTPQAARVATLAEQKQAAERLKAHATQLLRAKRGSQLGTKGQPSADVRNAQRGMGMPAAEQDGIYGPKTIARGKSLGVTLPRRV